jgi:NAD(P)-dependent dehydrogenase (short-subunit alcohol dehydrogenase family)
MIAFNKLEDIDLSHKTVLITGANNGLGYETSRYFAQHGAQVLMTSRSLERGTKAMSLLMSEFPNANIKLFSLDLGDSKSIDALATDLHAQHIYIDILINNAGIMAVPYALTKDGYESQIGVNHLGHFRLTGLLLDLIKDNGRIVNLSSMAHKAGTLNFNNFMYEKGKYSAFGSYSRSKLCNLLFTFELANQLEQSNRNITVVASHPGVAKTGLFDPNKRNKFIQFFINLYLNNVSTAEDGAKPIIMAALDPQAQNRDYYGPAKVKGEVQLEKPIPAVFKKENQKDLWTYSEDKTQVHYVF